MALRLVSHPALLVLALPVFSVSRLVNFEDAGAVSDDASLKTALHNAKILNETLAELVSGDMFIIPNKTFTFMGGVVANGLKDVTVRIDGTLRLSNDTDHYPKGDKNGSQFPKDGIYLHNIQNVTFTSAGKGIIDGNGEKWWGLIKYLFYTNHRPLLLHIDGAKQILMENILFLNAPRFNVFAEKLDGVEIRNCDVFAQRDKPHPHSVKDLSAFNTDGFDVSGRNVWIHDCTIYNQDDCIAVKKDAENMLFERVHASGLGLSIGGIGSSTVRNITFRDCYMNETYKGIYIKLVDNKEPGSISDILYENIHMEKPIQWPIWIGPAQQAISGNPCHASPCSLCWPQVPGSQCNVPAGTFANITLRNIFINKPEKSPGVILGNKSNPMRNIIFDNVTVKKPGTSPWGSDYYKCDGVESGVATGGTWPVPPCFKTALLQDSEFEQFV